MAKTKGKKQQGKAVKNKSAGAGKRTTQNKTTAGKGAQTAPADPKSCTAKGSKQKLSSPASTRQRSQNSRSKPRANVQSKEPTAKKPLRRKNISQTIPNGTLVHTTDDMLFGADGKSVKSRMATVVDSNRNNEVAIVKYTTSETNGTPFKNSKGFKGYGNRIYTKTVDGKAITISEDGAVKKHSNNKRDITLKQANQIKKSNLRESKYRGSNRAMLRELKGRKKPKK
ncbi:MAG: hypothetical protein ACI4MS_06515 [Candidatus Coproplasma sp.]